MQQSAMGRGGGKSTFTAAIACAAVDVDGPIVEPMAECLVVASSFDQGLINFRHMLHFYATIIRAAWDGADVGDSVIQDSANRATITDRETGAMIRVVGSDATKQNFMVPRLSSCSTTKLHNGRLNESSQCLRRSRLRGARYRKLAGLVAWHATGHAKDHPFQRVIGAGVVSASRYATRPSRTIHHVSKAHLAEIESGSSITCTDLESVIRAEAADAKRDESAMHMFRALAIESRPLRIDNGLRAYRRRHMVAGQRALPEPDARSRMHTFSGLDLGQNAAMSAGAAYFRDGTLEAVQSCFPELPSLAARGLADGVGILYQQMADRGELFQAGRRVVGHSCLVRECLERWGRPDCAIVAATAWRLAELKQHLRGRVSSRLPNWWSAAKDFAMVALMCEISARKVLGDHVRPTQSLLLRASMSEATGDKEIQAGNWKLAKHVQGGRRANARDDSCAAAMHRCLQKAIAGGLRNPRGRAGGTEGYACVSPHHLQMHAHRWAQAQWRGIARLRCGGMRALSDQMIKVLGMAGTWFAGLGTFAAAGVALWIAIACQES